MVSLDIMSRDSYIFGEKKLLSPINHYVNKANAAATVAQQGVAAQTRAIKKFYGFII